MYNHIKYNVSSICHISNLSSVQEYVGGLGQLFSFPRKIVEFPIHFCLVYKLLFKIIARLDIFFLYSFLL
jgi:hypothetical protein